MRGINDRRQFQADALLAEWDGTVGLGADGDSTEEECSVDILYSWAQDAAVFIREQWGDEADR